MTGKAKLRKWMRFAVSPVDHMPLGDTKCRNLDKLWYQEDDQSLVVLISRSICYRKKLTALYVRGAWDLLIISNAELMKLQLASPILPCVYINMLWWLHLSSVLSWEIFLLSLFKRERGGEASYLITVQFRWLCF